jgi:putative transposase
MADTHSLSDRQSIRLKGYDYSSRGCYFVTICAARRECLFGIVDGDKTVPSPAGWAVVECWNGLPDHYPDVHLDSFVLMPNHVHGIIVLTRPAWNGLQPVATQLSEVVRAFKTFSAQRINQLRVAAGQAVWQRGYFEHIVRTPAAHEGIRKYIAMNPMRWGFDAENPQSRNPEDIDSNFVKTLLSEKS